jgi:hypothetical protein
MWSVRAAANLGRIMQKNCMNNGPMETNALFRAVFSLDRASRVKHARSSRSSHTLLLPTNEL